MKLNLYFLPFPKRKDSTMAPNQVVEEQANGYEHQPKHKKLKIKINIKLNIYIVIHINNYEPIVHNKSQKIKRRI